MQSIHSTWNTQVDQVIILTKGNIFINIYVTHTVMQPFSFGRSSITAWWLWITAEEDSIGETNQQGQLEQILKSPWLQNKLGLDDNMSVLSNLSSVNFFKFIQKHYDDASLFLHRWAAVKCRPQGPTSLGIQGFRVRLGSVLKIKDRSHSGITIQEKMVSMHIII